jgi:hypothetical protein
MAFVDIFTCPFRQDNGLTRTRDAQQCGVIETTAGTDPRVSEMIREFAAAVGYTGPS